MHYMKEHHCPHIRNTPRSWGGIDRDSNGSFKGHDWSSRNRERPAFPFQSIQKAPQRDQDHFRRRSRRRQGKWDLRGQDVQKHFTKWSHTLDLCSHLETMSQVTFSNFWLSQESTIDIESVEARDPATYDCPTMLRAVLAIKKDLAPNVNSVESWQTLHWSENEIKSQRLFNIGVRKPERW